MFQKATPGAAAAQAEEEEDWEEEEEEMEEEPLDPAQVQAAQEAAAEKKRLQDLESVQLQRKFKEKQRLPKYRERQQQRASLPAYQMKAAIVQAIEEHTITVISGDTG
jgi:HrpA-like RNA helicase